MAYTGAVLALIGAHNPKKFPTFEKAFPDAQAKRVAQTPDDIFAAMSGWVDVVQAIIPNKEEAL